MTIWNACSGESCEADTGKHIFVVAVCFYCRTELLSDKDYSQKNSENVFLF